MSKTQHHADPFEVYGDVDLGDLAEYERDAIQTYTAMVSANAAQRQAAAMEQIAAALHALAWSHGPDWYPPAADD